MENESIVRPPLTVFDPRPNPKVNLDAVEPDSGIENPAKEL